MKKILIVIISFIWGLTSISAQVNLSFNPEKGKKYEYNTKSASIGKSIVMGQEIPVEMIMSMKYMMEVIDKKPQETTVRFTYGEIAYLVSNPMMKMEYDSKNPSENSSEFDKLLHKMFDKMLSQSFLAVITTNGSIISITGMDAIAESMTNAIANDGQFGAMIGEQMKQQFSDAATKSMFEQAFKIYPDNAIKAGNSWNFENTMVANEMNSTFRTKYTLKELVKNVATISVESQIEMTPIAAEGKLNGVQTGTITVDAKTGIPLKSEINQDVKGTVKMQGMDILTETASKTISTITEVK